MGSSIQSRKSANIIRPAATSVSHTSAGTTSLNTMLQQFRKEGRGQSGVFGTTLMTALEAVWANRVRSLLTMLGIVIGIAAVIGSLTMVGGISAYFDSVLVGQGGTNINVMGFVSNNRPGVSVKANQTHPSLTARDLISLGKLPHIVGISPWVSTGRRQVVYGNQNWNTSIVGVSIDIQSIQGWNVAQGVWFSQTQDAGGDAVAMLGDTVAQKLFEPGVNPVGKQVRIGTELFMVSGVLAPRGQGLGGVSDDSILIPYKAAQARLLNQTYFGNIYVAAESVDTIDLVSQEITFALEQNHRIVRNNPDDFQIQTAVQVKQQADQGTAALSILFAGIAAISLTVGGVGIMNIMLVSVTERTREIGIRMAIGARRSDIRNQFLIEALILCLAGAVFGTLLGLLIGWLMAGVLVTFIAGSAGGTSIPLVITPTVVLMPVIVSLLIGLVFGLYPAIRASRLDPIIAIRRAK